MSKASDNYVPDLIGRLQARQRVIKVERGRLDREEAAVSRTLSALGAKRLGRPPKAERRTARLVP